jgi:hypothetical protein
MASGARNQYVGSYAGLKRGTTAIGDTMPVGA